MKTLYYVTARNMKLFFKDKGMFFTSLITPLILLVLFFTFLGNVYRDTFLSFVPDGVQVPAALADGFVGGWLLSSMLAVCCITVAFCSNMQMVQDKGQRRGGRPFRRAGQALDAGARLFSVRSLHHADHLRRRFVRWPFLSVAGGLVSDAVGRAPAAFRHGSACAVRYGAVVARQRLSFHAGTAFGRRDDRQLVLRLYLRRVYAAFPVQRRTAECHFISSGDLRHGADPPSADGRRLCRAGGRLSAGQSCGNAPRGVRRPSDATRRRSHAADDVRRPRRLYGAAAGRLRAAAHPPGKKKRGVRRRKAMHAALCA